MDAITKSRGIELIVELHDIDNLTFNRPDVIFVAVSFDINAMLKAKSHLTDDEFINDELGDETLKEYVEYEGTESEEDDDLDVDDEVDDISSDDEEILYVLIFQVVICFYHLPKTCILVTEPPRDPTRLPAPCESCRGKAKLLDITRKVVLEGKLNDWFNFDLDANVRLIRSIINHDYAKYYKDWKNDLHNYFKDLGGADNEEYVRDPPSPEA
ncbi:hypothetical protein TIFTF001_004400 [Ficus carica]|uniref:Uncharacterized protein n=1 Tax=Ficus carica TaxID=3494 RepID=A0AA87ZV44_FICCA|nr:hypothetical protein TIFTF001_004400 [Ficus carica]